MRVSKEFKDLIVGTPPMELAKKWLDSESVHAFSDVDTYNNYLDLIRSDYPECENLSITGSGNWCYSLNPRKNFSKFHEKSDIDVSIISSRYFSQVWEEIRGYHRKNYYLIDKEEKDNLNRNGQNIYSGFVTPKWVPDRKSKTRFQYEINTNKYSNEIVGFRSVNMMFFRNEEEFLDYYIRGIRIAKSRLK